MRSMPRTKPAREHGLAPAPVPRGRAFGEQALQLLVDRRLDLGRVHALLDVGADDEVAAELRRHHVDGADAVDQLVPMHQALVQARGCAAAEHLREQLQAVDVGGAVLRPRSTRGRCAPAAPGRSCVARGRPACARRRRPSAAPSSGRPGCRRSTARPSAFAVARSMSPASTSTALFGPYQAAEPALHVVERGGVEVVHRADRRCGGTGGPSDTARLQQRVADLAVGLVLALALLVLHHAALLVERRLVDRAEQVAHAVGLHPQRHVERGGRHVLEVVGAVRSWWCRSGRWRRPARTGAKNSPLWFSEPWNIRCSNRCAKPLRPAGSSLLPTWYQMFTATIGALRSVCTITRRPLGRVNSRTGCRRRRRPARPCAARREAASAARRPGRWRAAAARAPAGAEHADMLGLLRRAANGPPMLTARRRGLGHSRPRP